MSLYGVSQFIVGFVLAIAILFGAGVGVTRYILFRLSAPPVRPTFANDPSPAAAPVAASPAAPPAASPDADAPSAAPDNTDASPAASPAAASPVATPTASPSTTPSPTGFTARVIQPVGLILRQDPTADSPQIGGVEYKQQVTVLENSQDGQWQHVRLSNGNEGWVKAGNTEQVN